jgi:NADPH2:quinone reductase
MRAIQVSEFGGPEVLRLCEVPDPEASDGLVPVEVAAAGINYADTHQAENSYLQPAQLPLIPGAEVVGTTPDGERVVSLLAGGGGYAERALVAPPATVRVPDGVADGDALAIVLQGVTAWHILRTSARLEEGETVLVHAAAGGVGSLAVQLAKRWGAGRVVAAASSDEKRDLALELGADAVLDSRAEDLAGAIEEAAGGKVDVVLEMVGGRTFDDSLAVLAPWGRVVTYGMASRRLPKPIDPIDLSRRSLAVVGFWLVNCFRRPGMFTEPANELLRMVAAGELRPVVGGTYPLADARRAHEDLRGRRTVGKLVLDPRL